MRTRIPDHVRSNAIAYLALFVALGGTGAWAAGQITSSDIAKNAVRSKHIKNRSLLPKDSKGGAIAAFAYVREVSPAGASTATIGYGRGVAGVDDHSTSYTVRFASSVRKCVVQAVPGGGKPYGDPGTTWSVGSPATVDMSEQLGPKVVQVYIRDEDNNPVYTSFLITAIC